MLYKRNASRRPVVVGASRLKLDIIHEYIHVSIMNVYDESVCEHCADIRRQFRGRYILRFCTYQRKKPTTPEV